MKKEISVKRRMRRRRRRATTTTRNKNKKKNNKNKKEVNIEKKSENSKNSMPKWKTKERKTTITTIKEEETSNTTHLSPVAAEHGKTKVVLTGTNCRPSGQGSGRRDNDLGPSNTSCWTALPAPSKPRHLAGHG